MKARRQHIHDLALGGPGLSSSGVRSPSGNHSKIESAVVRMLDMDARIDRELAACYALMDEAERLIQQVPGELYQSLLSMRYVSCMRWEIISRKLNYSTTHVFRLHGLALREADRILRTRGADNHGAGIAVRGTSPVRDRDRRDNHVADPLAAKADEQGAGKKKGRGTV